ncbi:hypothetical protein [Shewanella sp. cp20]|uniref:hypothetical protein n=1 Tax=Shewanella sp. cp20 TaxID=1521167 RepID=UPI0005A255CD|nr:hypothetical protein [Shewanella sp. cp20]KIO38374.1 hypothetical protein DB48_00255 [Shewanella sp. cp20]
MNKLTKVSLIASLLVGASFSASADDFIPTDITAKLERHLATQMQEMMVTAQQELTLSLQTQLSDHYSIPTLSWLKRRLRQKRRQ